MKYLQSMIGLIFIINLFVFPSSSAIAFEIEEGCYKIKNRGLSVGLLSWTHNESPSGHLAQVLAERGAYPSERERYNPGGRYRNDILWDIRRQPEGGYTIKNRGLSVGLLSWTHNESPSGHLAQVLAERGAYPSERERYNSGGRYRNDILWDITRQPEGGYTIKNRGLSVGILSWTHNESPSGHLAQVLAERGAYPSERERYNPGGRYRNDILWDLEKI